MASRDRTREFTRYRDSFRGAARPPAADPVNENSKDGRKIVKQKLLDGNSSDIEMGVMAEVPPWVRNVETTQTLFAMIHKKREELSKQMGKSKRVGFDDEGEKQRRQQISAISDEISDLFKQCERNIQSVVKGMDPKDKQDCTMRKNVQVALATQLHEESVPFRKEQKRYLEKLKENETKSKYVPTANSSGYEDEGFGESQLAMLADSEFDAQAREKEIVHVAESIKDLQTIFKELAVLVIDQGTIIDRIDYNIEKAAEHTGRAKSELEKAERSHRRNPAMCCIIVLSVLLGLMTFILVLKVFGYVNI